MTLNNPQNKTDHEYLGPKELYCVMGCNDAVNRYFKWLQSIRLSCSLEIMYTNDELF